LEENGVEPAMFFAGTVGSHSTRESGRRKFEKKAQIIGENACRIRPSGLLKTKCGAFRKYWDLTAIFFGKSKLQSYKFLYISGPFKDFTPLLGKEKLMPV